METKWSSNEHSSWNNLIFNMSPAYELANISASKIGKNQQQQKKLHNHILQNKTRKIIFKLSPPTQKKISFLILPHKNGRFFGF